MARWRFIFLLLCVSSETGAAADIVPTDKPYTYERCMAIQQNQIHLV